MTYRGCATGQTLIAGFNLRFRRRTFSVSSYKWLFSCSTAPAVDPGKSCSRPPAGVPLRVPTEAGFHSHRALKNPERRPPPGISPACVHSVDCTYTELGDITSERPYGEAM